MGTDTMMFAEEHGLDPVFADRVPPVERRPVGER
jgi:hypothetical protein